MLASRVFPRVLRRQALGQLCRSLPPSRQHHHLLPGASPSLSPASASSEPCAGFRKIDESKYVYHGRTGLQLVHFSSSASPESNSKESNQPVEEQGDGKKNDTSSEQISQDKEDDLSVEDLIKLVAEKDELLQTKNEEMEKMHDKVLRSYADMENVLERTKREAENAKKFGIQNFAKSLLDVADNLGRASSVGKDSLLKLESSETGSSEAVRRLKELLEGVEMTVKQLTEVFKKNGLEQFDPLNEQFDPNKHNAVVQVPDASKPPGTVSVVLKTGYILHGRIIRPAEVVVVSQPEEAVENQTEQSPAA